MNSVERSDAYRRGNIVTVCVAVTTREDAQDLDAAIIAAGGEKASDAKVTNAFDAGANDRIWAIDIADNYAVIDVNNMRIIGRGGSSPIFMPRVSDAIAHLSGVGKIMIAGYEVDYDDVEKEFHVGGRVFTLRQVKSLISQLQARKII